MSKRRITPKRTATKREVASWQRQRCLQKITFAAGIAVMVLVLGLMGFGYWDTQIRPHMQLVLRVNDTAHNVDDFARLLRLTGAGGNPAQMADLIEPLAKQLQNADVIKQASKAQNLTATPAEIDQKIIDDFSKDSQGNTVSNEEAIRKSKQFLTQSKMSEKDFRDIMETNVLQEKVRDYVGKQQVPVAVPQIDASVIVAADQSDAVKVSQRLQQGESFDKIANDVSLLKVGDSTNVGVGWLPEGVQSKAFDEAAFSLAKGQISQPTYDDGLYNHGGYGVVHVYSKQEDIVRARGFLVGSRKDADDVKAQLQGGADFAALVLERSQDGASQGRAGDLGQINKSDKNTDFEKFLFTLDVSTTAYSGPVFDSKPVTKGGYWIIKVNDKDGQKDLDKDMRERLVNKAFTDWVENQKKSAKIDLYLTDANKALIIKLASK